MNPLDLAWIRCLLDEGAKDESDDSLELLSFKLEQTIGDASAVLGRVKGILAGRRRLPLPIALGVSSSTAGTITVKGWFGRDFSDREIRHALARIPRQETVTLSLDSEGGDLNQAWTLYWAVRTRGDVVTECKGLGAWSAALLPFQAGMWRTMQRDSTLFLHNPWLSSSGDFRALGRDSEFLRKHRGAYADVLAERSGQSTRVVRDLMDAKSVLNGERALALGFTDAIRN